jgi:hypothetical protein
MVIANSLTLFSCLDCIHQPIARFFDVLPLQLHKLRFALAAVSVLVEI